MLPLLVVALVTTPLAPSTPPTAAAPTADAGDTLALAAALGGAGAAGGTVAGMAAMIAMASATREAGALPFLASTALVPIGAAAGGFAAALPVGDAGVGLRASTGACFVSVAGALGGFFVGFSVPRNDVAVGVDNRARVQVNDGVVGAGVGTIIGAGIGGALGALTADVRVTADPQ